MTRSPGKSKTSGLETVAILVVAVATLYLAQDVLIPVVLSVLLAFLLARPVTWLERRRFGRVPSVLAVVSLAFIVIGTLGYVVGQQAVSLAENLPHYQGEIERKIGSIGGTGAGFGSGVVSFLERLSQDFSKAAASPASRPASQPASQPATGPATEPAADAGVIQNAAKDISSDPHQVVAREAVGGPPATATSAPGSNPANPLFTVSQGQPESPLQVLLKYVGVVAGPLGTAGLVVVFVIFILLEREALRDRFIAVISRGNYTVTTRAINDATERIGKYLLAQSIVNGSYGVIIGLGLFVIGLIFGHGVWFPSFVLWGLLCAMLRFIPYVGPAVSSLFPVVLALAVFPGFSVAIAVVSLFVVVELISNNVMEPWLYGASTGLSTVAILVAAIFWTWLWGPVGLLVATPLTVCIAVIGKYVRPLKFLHVLLGDEDALPPSVAYYQRLLAGARLDAEKIVKRVIEEKGLLMVPDVVYLPALRMARRDRREDELSIEDETRLFEDTLAIANPSAAVVALPSKENPLSGRQPLVIACPAHHRADEVALQVLADALAPVGRANGSHVDAVAAGRRRSGDRAGKAGVRTH